MARRVLRRYPARDPLGEVEVGAFEVAQRPRLREAGAQARVLLIAGRPLKESIMQYGPFVMNTQAEIRQAIDDFRAGKMGDL